MDLDKSRPVDVVEYSNTKPGLENVRTYDAVRYEGGANEYKQRVMESAYTRLVGSVAGKRILDVGCGTGRGIVHFAGQAMSAVGSDASCDMLRVAAGKAVGLGKCGFVAAYAQRLPFEANQFDVVMSLNFLHLFSVETQRVMVVEMKRVTKPGGIIVLEFDNALHGLVVGLWKRWFSDERGSLPWEVSRVVGRDCSIVRVHGAVFPIVWRLLWHFPNVASALEKIAYVPPFSWLSHRIYLKLLKTHV